MDHSLQRANRLEWVLHPNYNSSAAVLIERAYPPNSYPEPARESMRKWAERALAIARYCLRLRLAKPQRLRAQHIEMKALSQFDEPTYALESTDKALYLASELSDYSALIDLYVHRGGLNYGMLRLGEAAKDYRKALTTMREYSDVIEHPYPGHEDTEAVSFHIHTATLIANFAFFMNQWRVAQNWLDEARRLLPQLPDAHIEAAGIAYVQAHLDRWQGEPALALGPAADAVGFFEVSGATNSASRACIFAAEAALDYVDRLPEGSFRTRLAVRASEYVERAVRLAQAIRDPNALEMARLVQTRCDRAVGRHSNRLGRIDIIIENAHKRDDTALLAQAFTAYGDEWASRNELGYAYSCYERVLSIVEGSNVPALNHWALLALNRGLQA